MLDLIEEHELADRLLMLAQKQSKLFRKIRLKQSKTQTDDMVIDSRWKVIVNQEIETDEI
jgi:hypothetical protein